MSKNFGFSIKNASKSAIINSTVKTSQANIIRKNSRLAYLIQNYGAVYNNL